MLRLDEDQKNSVHRLCHRLGECFRRGCDPSRIMHLSFLPGSESSDSVRGRFMILFYLPNFLILTPVTKACNFLVVVQAELKYLTDLHTFPSLADIEAYKLVSPRHLNWVAPIPKRTCTVIIVDCPFRSSTATCT